MKSAIADLCKEHNYELITMEVMPDHVHVFLSAPPKVAPAVIAKVFKGASARMLFTRHPELKKKLWGGHLWNPFYYVGTAGDVSKETVKKYTELQKAGEPNADD